MAPNPSQSSDYPLLDLEVYLREGEPGAAARADAWQTAIGLQAVDGLRTSRYLYETAIQNIEGAIGIDEAERRIQGYYEALADRREVEDTREGDVVASRIVRLLGERAFTFSPIQLKSIHGRLFDGMVVPSGEYRPYNITKREWVLRGDSVVYASYETIEETLDYDFGRERSFDYRSMSKADVVRHVASFISGIWQIHPFCEGNTRTVAVFAIKYLRSVGYEVDNAPFKEHSWYFRNALVRANYDNYEEGIVASTSFLECFFENLLLGAHHELRNRYLHVDWRGGEGADKRPTNRADGRQMADKWPTSGPDGRQMTNGIVLSRSEASVLSALERRDESTTRVLAEATGLSARTTRRVLSKLVALGLVVASGANKNRSYRISR